MLDSLKSQIKSLWHKGKITDAECKKLLEELYVQKGEWIPIYLMDVEWGWRCPFCKEVTNYKSMYCPHCGARLGDDE